MKRKIWLSVFLGLFLVLSLTFSVGLALCGPSEAGANEQLSNLPKLTEKDGTWNENYLTELADFINDRFFLRQELITLDNRLTAGIFATSGEDSVICGREGWLFFTDTLADYTGTAPLTERELFALTNNIRLMEEYCTANGREFVFVVAPNKNSVYGKFMPDFGLASGNTPGKALVNSLTQQGISAVDLYQALALQPENLYFAHDSHWNSKGAALGADLINAALGVESSYFAGDCSRLAAHDGDLYAMVYPAAKDGEKNPVYGGTLVFSYTGRGKAPDSIVLETAGQGDKHLLAYRDSFGNLLYPYLADSYGTAYFSRSKTYDLTREGDCVMVEIVERNIRDLMTNVPIMAAPVAELSSVKNGEGTVTLKQTPKKEMVLAQGTLPQTPDARTRVYLQCEGKFYEAFLLAEGGFAAYLPGNAEAVVYSTGDTPVRLEINK